MSLQNLSKPNNYKLYCNNINPNTVTFNDLPISPPVTSYTIDNYVEYNGTLLAHNAIPDTNVAYSAVLIGNTVNVSIQNFLAVCSLTLVPITLSSLPIEAIPLTDKIVIAPILIDIGLFFGVLVIRSGSGNIEMYSSPKLEGFVGGARAGFFMPTISPEVPDPSYYFSFSYNIN